MNNKENEEEKEMNVGKLSRQSKTCTVLAHNKMVLHALSHLHRPIFGLLIGNTFRNDKSNKTEIHIMDIIPLQHNIFSSMVIEIAFLQIQEYLKKLKEDYDNDTIQICGVYFCNSHSDDVSINTSAIIIAQQLIKQYTNKAILLCQVVSDRINQSYKGVDSSLDWYSLKNNGNADDKYNWKQIENVYNVLTNKPNIKEGDDEKKYENWLVNTKDFNELDFANKGFGELNLKSLLKNKAEEKIYDFDDHLDDQSKDWRNFQLFNL